MKFLCAPDNFKESLETVAVATAMAAGIRSVDPAHAVDACAVADGGEGTLDALLAAFGGDVRRAIVTGPLGTPVEARFAVADRGRLGIIELAEASGLTRIPRTARDPTRTTTYGTGELIAHAAKAGCTRIIVGLGGSGTCDGGAGLAQALGVRFFDEREELIPAPISGGSLRRIARIEKPPGVASIAPSIVAACDVRNPLLGDRGTAVVYGPQKGATRAQVVELDQGLANFAARAGADTSREGAGAAGGAGYGLLALCGATLVRGIDLVLDAVGFNTRCAGVDFVLTGEGCLEANSLDGKAAIGVALAARTHGTPAIAIVGSTGLGADRCLVSAGGPLHAYVSLTERFGHERAMNDTAACVSEVAADIVRSLESDPPG